jgi:hypothetical protein
MKREGGRAAAAARLSLSFSLAFLFFYFLLALPVLYITRSSVYIGGIEKSRVYWERGRAAAV